jgi:hypothetical protein
VDGGHRLVFVCGLHRSGTSALARVLGDHPEISGLSGTGAKEDEGQFLQDVYLRARHHGGPGRFAFDPAAHLTEVEARAIPGAAQRLWDSWQPYWDLDARLLLEKSPPNLLMTRFLAELFPDASFVTITRHPVVVSLSTDKWLRFGSLHRSVEHWLTAHEIFAADAALLERVHVLKYEELVADPSGTLAGVARFLELDGEIPADAWRSDRSRRYEEQWDQMATSLLHRGQRRRVVRDFAERAAAFGYDVEELGALSPWTPASASGVEPTTETSGSAD